MFSGLGFYITLVTVCSLDFGLAIGGTARQFHYCSLTLKYKQTVPIWIALISSPLQHVETHSLWSIEKQLSDLHLYRGMMHQYGLQGL